MISSSRELTEPASADPAGRNFCMAMARVVLFLFSLYFILIKPYIPGPKTELSPENCRLPCSIGSGETVHRCHALLHTKLRSKLLCRGGQGEDISKLEEMPTFIPAPRLVGTKECPPEEIISTFHTPALKKDILV